MSLMSYVWTICWILVNLEAETKQLINQYPTKKELRGQFKIKEPADAAGGS